MSLSALRLKVLTRLRTEALARVSIWAVTQGAFPACKVVAHAVDAIDANLKLCALLDIYFESNLDRPGHDFEIRALRIPIPVGSTLSWRDEVKIP